VVVGVDFQCEAFCSALPLGVDLSLLFGYTFPFVDSNK
jgi:hypothetical protein